MRHLALRLRVLLHLEHALLGLVELGLARRVLRLPARLLLPVRVLVGGGPLRLLLLVLDVVTRALEVRERLGLGLGLGLRLGLGMGLGLGLGLGLG